jgi:hypothetical protein
MARLPGSCESSCSRLLSSYRLPQFIAITAVEKKKPKEPEPSLMEIDEGAWMPFAQQIIREATQAAERAAADVIGKATRQESRPELKVVGEA